MVFSSYSRSLASALLIPLLESLLSLCRSCSFKFKISSSISLVSYTFGSILIYIFDLSCLKKALISSSCYFLILAPTFFRRMVISFLYSFLWGRSPKNHECFFSSRRLILVLGLWSSNLSTKSTYKLKFYLWTQRKDCNVWKIVSKNYPFPCPSTWNSFSLSSLKIWMVGLSLLARRAHTRKQIDLFHRHGRNRWFRS